MRLGGEKPRKEGCFRGQKSAWRHDEPDEVLESKELAEFVREMNFQGK